MNHTLTPYKTDGKTVFNSKEKGIDTIAHVVSGNDKETKAIAEFIVRACNAHDELLLAAKEAAVILSEIAKKFTREARGSLLISPGFTKLIGAINKAEGK